MVELQFSREIGHHLVQTFVPSFLVVALSWFSFWLGLEAIPGRVTLLVTSLLTITTLFTGIKEGLPPVAYVKVSLSVSLCVRVFDIVIVFIALSCFPFCPSFFLYVFLSHIFFSLSHLPFQSISLSITTCSPFSHSYITSPSLYILFTISLSYSLSFPLISLIPPSHSLSGH